MSIYESLAAWVDEQLALRSIPTATLTPIVGDAGFRQYYRLATPMPLLAVYGPPEIEKHQAFVQISEHWQMLGVPAPKIVAYDFAKGFLLIQDFGATSLSAALEPHKGHDQALSDCYRSVLAQLRPLQVSPTEDWYPRYDRPALQAELDLLIPWFIEQLLGYALSNDEQKILQTLFDRLIGEALSQPQVIVHRDFHCRNIHLQDEALERLGFIDFQDAVVGPVTYDIASLLKDCYQCWPSSFVRTEALNYRETLPPHLQMASAAAFLNAMNAIGLQRHLKVLGIFARLYLRDGKAQYLQDLPLVVAYVRQVFAQYDYCQPVARWFDACLMPLIQKQSWHRSVEIQP